MYISYFIEQNGDEESHDYYTFMLRLSKNSGSLELLQPWGPVQACNGIS